MEKDTDRKWLYQQIILAQSEESMCAWQGHLQDYAHEHGGMNPTDCRYIDATFEGDHVKLSPAEYYN